MVGTQLAVLIAGVAGIVPSMGFMLFVLSPHEDQFEDKDAFLGFGFGFIVGVVLSVIQWFVVYNYIDSIETVTPLSTLVVGLLLALIITMVMTFWSNRGKYFRTDTAKFVGIGVACGLSTALVFAKIYADLQEPFDDHGDSVHFYIKNALYIISVILINTAGGIATGNEIAKGNFKLGILKCSVLLALFYPLMFFHMVYFDPAQQWGFLVALSLIGGLAFLFQYTRHAKRTTLEQQAEEKAKEDEGSGSRKKARRGSRRRRR